MMTRWGVTYEREEGRKMAEQQRESTTTSKLKLARVFPRHLVCACNVLVPAPVDEDIFMASIVYNVKRRLLMFFY